MHAAGVVVSRSLLGPAEMAFSGELRCGLIPPWENLHDLRLRERLGARFPVHMDLHEVIFEKLVRASEAEGLIIRTLRCYNRTSCDWRY